MSNWLGRFRIISIITVFMLSGCTAKDQASMATNEVQWASMQAAPGVSFETDNRVREFRFPDDHGSHPDFLTEWWYFTGNLSGESGKEFGYQLTFFRRALEPGAGSNERTSSLASSQVYMAHFTLTDAGSESFTYAERFQRGNNIIAGAKNEPVSVWLQDWRFDQLPDGRFSLAASHEDISIDLILEDDGGVALQGEAGLSRKSASSASYYYSMPFLTTSGTIISGGTQYRVTGQSWMDHEFSSGTLAPGQIGWDWFSIHLDDGTAIMAYQMRLEDGSIDPYSHGSVMDPGGKPVHLASRDFDVKPLSTWKSSGSGAEYPSGWELIIPSQNTELTIQPLLQDQELALSYTYWEGAVKVSGTVNGVEVSGSGYVELTGYAASMQGQF